MLHVDIATGSLVVGHVLGGGRELGVALDHLRPAKVMRKESKISIYIAGKKSRTQSTSRKLYLVDCVQEVLFCGHLPPCPADDQVKPQLPVQSLPNGEHAGLGADAPELGPGGVGAEPGQQLVADVLFHTHRPGRGIYSERARTRQCTWRGFGRC